MPTAPFNVLVLEDDPNRIKKFKGLFLSLEERIQKRIEVQTTDDIPTAQGWLASPDDRYDLILLDHDLAEETKAPGSVIIQAKFKGETGYDLAHWLGMNPAIAHRHCRYITHSLNEPGRKRICAAFRSLSIGCEEAPFLWEESVFQKHINFPDPPTRTRYDFYKLIGTTQEDFDALPEDRQLDHLLDHLCDCAGALGREGGRGRVTDLVEHFDPTMHPLSVGIGLLAFGSPAMRNGHIKKTAWRAAHYRIKQTCIAKDRDWKLLLKGFPTAYLKDEICDLMDLLTALKEKVDTLDCRMGDDMVADVRVLRHLAQAVESMDAALAQMGGALVEARREEEYDD